VTVVDDDSASISTSEEELFVEELGAEETYTLVLRTPPTGPVTVTVESADPTAVQVSTGGATPSPSLELTFTPTTWNIPQTVTVTRVGSPADGDPAASPPTQLASAGPIPAQAQSRERIVMVTHTARGGGYVGVQAAVRVRTTPLTLDLTLDENIAGDDAVNIAEKAANFTLSGTVEAGAVPTVMVGSQSLTVAIDPTDATKWTAEVEANADYITEPSVEVTVRATMGSASRTVTRTLTVDLTPPIAAAGNPRTVAEGSTVTLDGSGSTDAASYLWSAPPEFVRNLANTDTAMMSFMADNVTQDTPVTFSLRVTDSAGNVATDEVIVTIRPLILTLDTNITSDDVVNRAEQLAGFPLSGTVEAGVTPTVMVGSQSLTTVAIDPTDATKWTAQVEGEAPYITEPSVEVVVTAAMGSASHTVTHTLMVDLTPPIAAAGDPITVAEGDTVMLDGSSSTDAVAYRWMQTAGTPTVTLTNEEAAQAELSFTAPGVTTEAELTFSLTVTDSAGNTATDTVAVTITPLTVTLTLVDVATDNVVNRAEQLAGFTLSGTVEAGATLTVTVGDEEVTTAIDENDPTRWTAEVGAEASYITEPSVEVVVRGTKGLASGTTTRSLTVDLTPPMAEAGDPQTVIEGSTVMLEGSGSSDAVSYLWSKPTDFTGDLVNPHLAMASFMAPDAAQSPLVFSLRVTDRVGNTATDTVAIAITPLTVTLDANIAADDRVNPAEKAAGFQLAGTVEAGVTLAVTVADQPLTVAIDENDPTRWVADVPGNASYITEPSVEVVATATMGSVSRTATRTLTVDLTPPTAEAGNAQSVEEGNTVVLDGSRSIDAVSYLWSKPTDFTGELMNANEAIASFTAPDVTQDTTLTFSLTVTDSAGNAATDTVAIAITPLTLTTLTVNDVTDDNTVNIAEKAGELQLSGTVEDGATVTSVRAGGMNGEDLTVTMPTPTTWRAAVPSDADYVVEPSFEVAVTATKGLASSSVTHTVMVDLTPPTAAAGNAQSVAEGSTVMLNGSDSTDAASYAWTQTEV